MIRSEILPPIVCASCEPTASNVADGTQGNLLTIVRSFAVSAAQDDRH